MKVITDIGKCTGCSACLNVCPKNCIRMKSDKEGFIYPYIIKKKCVNCNKCRRVCPVNKEKEQMNILQKKAFLAYSLNNTVRLRGSSGGIFGLLADSIIEKGGYVFGAAFDDDLYVKHVCISKKKDLQRLYMSKYVQSEIGLSYVKVKQVLEDNKPVLFTGTPCQIAGLMGFLGNKACYPLLITQEVVCHGVPSPLLWEKNLHFVSKANKKIVKNVFFRKKTRSWIEFSVEYVFSDGTVLDNYYKDDLYFKAFLNNYCLRQSCYNCQFKNQNSLADITLADFWGIENIVTNIDYKNGVSLVICNTTKGEMAVEGIKDRIYYSSIEYERAIKYNSAVCRSVDKPPHRDLFLKYVYRFRYEDIVQMFCDESSRKYSFLTDYCFIKQNKGDFVSLLWMIKNINRLK